MPGLKYKKIFLISEEKSKKMKKLLARIEEIFAEKLQEKSGWGKNEVMMIYKQSVNEALLELIDSEEG